MSLVEQFLEFIEQTPATSVRDLSARVLAKCRELTHAEAGSIFIIRRKGREKLLEAVSLQNDAVPVKSTGFVVPVSQTSISGYVAITGETVMIDDAYTIPGHLPYQFNRGFDDMTGFRTRSILCFPLGNRQGRSVGVVQLINRRGDSDTDVLPFLPEHAAMIAPVNHIVGQAIERADMMEQVAAKNARLKERNTQLRRERERVETLRRETEGAFMVSVHLLARAAELHDADTGNHILRVNEYSYLLASLAGQSRAFCNEIRFSAALHDVGKMSVDKAILHKKGRLDEQELVEMRKHTTYGFEILKASERLAMAAEIAHGHHEQWAGGGYPRGLRAKQIPLSARIVAIADIYDALRSPRPYKPGFTHDQSLDIMTKGDDRIEPARHFDPELIELFVANHAKFAAVWDALSDDPHGKVADV